MKKLIALLAILGFTPGAYAAGGADASHSGEFRLIYNSDMEFDSLVTLHLCTMRIGDQTLIKYQEMDQHLQHQLLQRLQTTH